MCSQFCDSLQVLGRKPSTESGKWWCLTFMEPQDCTWHLPIPQNSPGRKQGLHLTGEEMEAQRGAGTCPRSPSKVKECPKHLWKGRAIVSERVGRAEGVLMLPGKGQVGLSWFSRSPTSLPQGWGLGRQGAPCWGQGPGSQSSPPPWPRSPPAPGQPASLPIHVRPGWAVEERGYEAGLIPEAYWFRQPAWVIFLAA